MRALVGSLLAAGVLVVACGTDSATESSALLDGGTDAPSSDATADSAPATDSGTTACSAPSQCPSPSNPCQVATCNAGTCALVAVPDDTACNDGDLCSTSDVCKAGTCTGGALVTCAAQDSCHDVGVCETQTGSCSNPVKSDGAACGDSGKCKTGSCIQPLVLLAKQDFEEAPATPTWSFTGTPTYASGSSSPDASPPNSPFGIGASRAWSTTTQSAGVVLEFADVTIPAGFDRVKLSFRLAAMNTLGAGGGPDDLDYVLVAISVDGGTTYYDRLRLRGAITDNSFWGYDATGVASVAHLPESETTFQPTSSGLQTTLGYSTAEIVFPGTVTRVRTKITARSSSSTDTWLVDDVTLIGEHDVP